MRSINGTINRKKKKKILKAAKGYYGSKSKLIKSAREQQMKSLAYAYRDRRQVKRDFRKLWITRINAAVRIHDLSYSQFINGLKKHNILINRKMLSELAIQEPQLFESLIKKIKETSVQA